MAITTGTRIGPYEVKAPLGQGGMGVVFRALDTKLQRDVALKLLPDGFADDADRLARFQREAQVLASLNHPNIAQIFGFEENGATQCIVMELVDGPTLQERLQRGPIPIDEALAIAKQIADALEAAHERGIIHRDLKPANIKLMPDGKVKVLDFGLAKAIASARSPEEAAGLSNSPTLVSRSMPGVILGTAAYMSPEQARGRTVDKRTDIFAFGCVLFEMLTGRQTFPGEDTTEILGRIVTAEPDWSLLPSKTPAAIHRLLRRALKKDLRQRLADIRDARTEIEDAFIESEPSVTPQVISRPAFSYLTMMVFLIVVLAVVAVRYLREVPAPPASEVHLELTTPPTTDPTSLAISPDGKKLIFVATFEGRPSLWLRSLDSDTSKPFPGTAGASLPFWSPDNRSIGFFADSLLKRIDIDGGALEVLATASLAYSTGTWNKDGTILFSPMPGRPILRVPQLSAVTQIGASQESGHGFPLFLPDGRHFLYSVAVGSGLYAGQLGSKDTRQLIDGAEPRMYLRGHLLFIRDGSLLAQKFDPDRLEFSGERFQVINHILATPGGGKAVAASEAGTIVYRTASGNYHSQFVWFDRSGKETGRVGSSPDAALTISAPSISPDGNRIAVFRVLPDNADVWLLDLVRGVLSRFTSNPANDVIPIWSPDGARLVFSSTRKGGVHDLYTKSANGASDEELLLSTSEDKVATDWSPDERDLLYYAYDPKTQNDIWALPMTGDRKPFAVVQTQFEERNAQFSPDGKWIAYQSNESGRFEIYIQPFPGPGARTRVSTEGGAQARWRRDGKELFYVALDQRLMAVPVRLSTADQNVEVGSPVPLLTTHMPTSPEHLDGQQYIVSPDGQRFLINTIAEEANSPIKVILNWNPPSK